MPSVSKKQQKFMGIVRAIQKGEEPASKFSKDAQDAAKKMKKSSVKKYAKTKHGDLPVKKESWMNKLGGSYFEEGLQRDRNNLAMYIIDLNNMLSQAKLSKNPKAKKYIKFIQQDIKDAKKKLSKLKEERDYKDEYKKFQSSPKAKKYRAELNKYNRQKGTYGNGDGKDASHKGGKIVGFESQSKNRGRAEKSRLKKEINDYVGSIVDEVLVKSTYSPQTLLQIAKQMRESDESVNEIKVWDLNEKCWKGYEKKGMKTMFGKRYPNCVKKTKKEGVNENSAEKSKILKLMIKYGDNPKDAKRDLAKHYKKAKGDRSKATPSQLAQYIGYLSANESVNETVEMGKGVKKLMKIADEGYGKVGGTTVDSMSANLFKQLYDKANDDIKQKLNKKNEKQLVMIIGRMWKKFGKNVTIGSSV